MRGWSGVASVAVGKYDATAERGRFPPRVSSFTLRAMFTRAARIFALAALCGALGSCGQPWKKKEVPRARPIRFPKANVSDGTKGVPKQVGTVLMVNAEGNFVLIDSGGWLMPEKGAALKCMREGMETGVVAVGSERKGTHVAADVVTGTPQKGDQVFQ